MKRSQMLLTSVSYTHLDVYKRQALYIASQIVINLQSIVSRSLSPLDTAVVGIGTLHAGTQYNIVAKEALLEGTTPVSYTHLDVYKRQPNALEQVTDGKLVLKESEPFLAEQCRAFINFIENNESFK